MNTNKKNKEKNSNKNNINKWNFMLKNLDSKLDYHRKKQKQQQQQLLHTIAVK